MRRSIFIALGVFAFAAVLMIATVLLLPAERVGAFAAAKASAALDRVVQVERFGVRLFPRPAVTLEGVVVGGATPSDSALASADRVELRPRLLPLLRREVVIDEIVLERPLLRIVVAADSSSNLPEIETGAADAGARDAELSIRRLRVNDGAIVYRDATTGTAVSLAGITQALKLTSSITSGELTRVAAVGSLAIGDIDADAPGRLAWPIRDLGISLEHDVAVDREADRIELTQLTLTLQELALNVTGTVTAMTDSLRRTVDLRAQTGSVDVAGLIASLPKALLHGSSGDVLTGSAGRAQLDVAVTGRAGAGAIPDVTGVLSIEAAALARGRHGTIADGLNGRIALSLDSVSSDGISGRLLGEPLRVA
ncbi:MAG: AsmA family protein, partial [Longimicrobiales bacterium]